MKAAVTLDVDEPERLRQAVAPSLRSSDAVAFDTGVDGDGFHIDVETDRLGALRGATNSALMLSSLGAKILED